MASPTVTIPLDLADLRQSIKERLTKSCMETNSTMTEMVRAYARALLNGVIDEYVTNPRVAIAARSELEGVIDRVTAWMEGHVKGYIEAEISNCIDDIARVCVPLESMCNNLGADHTLTEHEAAVIHQCCLDIETFCETREEEFHQIIFYEENGRDEACRVSDEDLFIAVAVMMADTSMGPRLSDLVFGIQAIFDGSV